MPNLTEQTKSTRIVQTMAVLQLMLRGFNKKDACTQVGITIKVFDEWLSKEEDAILELKQQIVDAEKVRIADLYNAQQIILQKLITYATLETTILDAKDLIDISKYFGQLIKEADKNVGITEGDTSANEYLEDVFNGPVTRVEDSKMADKVERTKVNIRPLEDGSIDIEMERPKTFIDVSASDPLSPSEDS